jgi:hypothetical protein
MKKIIVFILATVGMSLLGIAGIPSDTNKVNAEGKKKDSGKKK